MKINMFDLSFIRSGRSGVSMPSGVVITASDCRPSGREFDVCLGNVKVFHPLINTYQNQVDKINTELARGLNTDDSR